MKNILFYFPFALFAIFYGFAAFSKMGAISPIVIAWLALFLVSGILLSKNLYWGSLFGMMPAINFIYMGTKDTGQIISETPIGIILLIYFIICGIFVLISSKK